MGANNSLCACFQPEDDDMVSLVHASERRSGGALKDLGVMLKKKAALTTALAAMHQIKKHPYRQYREEETTRRSSRNGSTRK
jgi:hypothetical protein